MVLDQVQAGDKQLELLETESKRLASGEVFFSVVKQWSWASASI